MQTAANRNPRLDRDYVAQAALRLQDEVGLDGLTVRRLGAELGVQGPALYWHFASKQDLLDLMAHEMTRPWLQSVPATAVGQPWDDWLTEVGRGYRALLLAHRDGARLVAGARPLPDSLPLLDACIAAFEASTGCGPGQALRSLAAVIAFVRGFVLDEHAALTRAADEVAAAGRPEGALAAASQPVPVPHLDAAIAEGGAPSGEGTFEYGLRLVVDGIRIALERSRA